MDIWNKKKRSEVMSKIRSKNTKPEITLRKLLFKEGYRYRINYKKLPGKPDIVFPKYKTALFIHGCFWHAHENCKHFQFPKSNVDFWKNKILSNVERDKSNIEKILGLGWKVLVIWECEIKKKDNKLLIGRLVELFHKEVPKPLAKIRFYEEIDNQIIKVAEEVFEYKKR